MKYGFYIRELRVTGPTVKPAIATFDKGFNVIAGASDTGKSYIYSCIEFMLGREEDPKYVPEAEGYTSVYMEIKDYQKEDSITLYRKFGESHFNYKRCKLNEFRTSKKELSQISIRHNSKNEANISRLLLKLCGLDNKELKTNKENEKVSLSFSEIRKLMCVHEQTIITENSPFYFSPQYLEYTKYQSLLNLLLTGEDASKLKTTEKEVVKSTRFKSKLELLNDQLERKLEKIRDVDEQDIILDDKTTKEDFENLNLNLLESNLEVENLGKKRNDIYSEIQTLKSKENHKKNLLNKFSILSNHYKSDLMRLKFIEEGGELLSQLSDQICPVCNQEITENHIHEIIENETMHDSVLAEMNKIKKKSEDLNDTVIELSTSLKNLQKELVEKSAEYDKVNNRLSKQLSPKIDFIRSRLGGIVRSEKLKERLSLLEAEVFELEQRIAEINHEMANKKDTINKSVISTVYLQKLSRFIEARLSAWEYQKKCDVTFDNTHKVFDIIIGGKLRKSYGKGKRGVSFAACIIGIMDYCNKEANGFSNTLILDSPLTAYDSNRKKKLEKYSSQNGIVNSFYSNLSKLNESKQIIVLDNKVPSPIIQNLINYIEFVGETGEKGRKGFFPIN